MLADKLQTLPGGDVSDKMISVTIKSESKADPIFARDTVEMYFW